MNCRYYTERTLGWMLNNKLIVFLSLLCFCLFVSTLALSGQKGRLQDEVNELRASLTTTEAPEASSEGTDTNPEGNPDENVPETNPDQTNPDETAPETNPDQTNPDETAPETNPDQTNPDETAPETNPDQTNPDETAPETNPDQTNPDETAPETEPSQTNSDEAGSVQIPAVLANTGTLESSNDDNANTSDKLQEIVKGSKLLSLIAA